jgi:hypothetical protein
MIPGHPQTPINTIQTLDSNRFRYSKSTNHKETRCNVANFNEFLSVAMTKPTRAPPAVRHWETVYNRNWAQREIALF